MLEAGHTVLDCQIIKPLLVNDVYQSYLVNCPESTVAKLFLLLPNPLLDQKQRQSFLDRVSWLSSQTFPYVGSPLKAGEIDGQLACLYPCSQGTSLAQTSTAGFSARIVERNGEIFAMTLDYREDRINLTIADDIVTVAQIG